jgi:predicted protein tyrosine phosphatase
MIKSVTITSLADAAHFSYRPEKKQNLWITTVDLEDRHKVLRIKRNLAQAGIPHFSQYFRDWSDEDPEPYIVSRIEIEGPKESHVNNIISFLEPYVASDTEYHLGVNCMAGISRSTAIGIIAWVMAGKTPEEALKEILNVRIQAWPNLRILRFASARLGKNIVTPISDWKENCKGLGVITL